MLIRQQFPAPLPSAPIEVIGRHKPLLSDVQPVASIEWDYPSVCRQVILEFLQRTGIGERFSSRRLPAEVKPLAQELLKTYNIPLADNLLEKYLRVGLTMARAYCHVDNVDLHVAMTLFTFCTSLADDDVIDPMIIRECMPLFYLREPQTHPFLALFVDNMTFMMRKHYDNYSANAITSSTMEFLNAEMFERDGSAEGMNVGNESTSYMEYIRWKTGLGEAYAVMIWPKHLCPETKAYIRAVPDAVLVIDYINEILSFYKEQKAGEEHNYVSHFAVTQGMTKEQVIRHLVDETITLIDRVRDLVDGPVEKHAWDSFVAGFCQFHLTSPRYRLHEILPEYQFI